MFGDYHLMFTSVNNLSDARYAAALGADYIGFNFDPNHPMTVSASSAKAMAQWVSGPLLGAELTVEHNAKNASDFIEILDLDLVFISTEQAEEMQSVGIDFMVRCTDVKPELLSYLKDFSHFRGMVMEAEPYLFSKPDFQLPEGPIFIILPRLNEEMVQWIAKSKPYGIALRGGMEDTPGYRDFEEVNDFFDQLEESSSSA